MSNGKPLVYLACPYFTDWQKKEVDRVLEVLTQCDYDCWFWVRDGVVVNPSMGSAGRREALMQNIKSIDKCDLLLAMVDGKSIYTEFNEEEMRYLKSLPDSIFKKLEKLVNRDVGTIFEMGADFVMSKPMVTYSVRGMDPNLMLVESCLGHVKNEQELIDCLNTLHPVIGSLEITEDKAKVIAEVQAKYKFRGEIY